MPGHRDAQMLSNLHTGTTLNAPIYIRTRVCWSLRGSLYWSFTVLMWHCCCCQRYLLYSCDIVAQLSEIFTVLMWHCCCCQRYLLHSCDIVAQLSEIFTVLMWHCCCCQRFLLYSCDIVAVVCTRVILLLSCQRFLLHSRDIVAVVRDLYPLWRPRPDFRTTDPDLWIWGTTYDWSLRIQRQNVSVTAR